MQHFYDGQIKRYLTQFMRLMSNFSYQDAKGRLVQVPVRYGDMNRQVAQILNKNSENIVQSAPFIACYIKNMEFARDRLQDPTYVSKLNIRERAFDENGQEYLNIQGANYTVERLMPTPFNLDFTADIWATNADQKFQILEQLLVLFNPSMEIQTNNNYIDWTSLSLVELTNLQFSSRSVPQGLEQDIDIASLTFKSPIWLTTPAKVKKLGVITKIITSVFDEATGTIESGAFDDPNGFDYFSNRRPISVQATTLGNFGILVLDNKIRLISEGKEANKPISWLTILDQYPGKFTAGLSSIRLSKPNGLEIVGFLSLDPSDDGAMLVNWDPETFISNTDIASQDGTYTSGFVDAVIDPTTFNPQANGTPAVRKRYLILENLNSQADAFANWQGAEDIVANANDIVEWDGSKWTVIFNSAAAEELTYITNQTTGIQYSWDGEAWLKSYEGIYDNLNWRLVL